MILQKEVCMKKKIAIAIGLIAMGATNPAFSDSVNVSYTFNKGNGFPGNGEQVHGGKQGYFPLSNNGNFEPSGRSGLALSNDVMVIGGLPPQSKDIPMTVSLWIKTSTDAAGSVITSKKHSESGQGFSVEFDLDMNVVFDMTDENGGSIRISTLTAVPADNMWHHIAVSYKGDGNANNVGLYIDGVVSELKLITDNLFGDVKTYHPLVIGSGPLYKQAISASIDEFYLLPQAFNDDQVTCLYQLKTDCAYRPTAGTQGARGLMGISGPQGQRGSSGPQGSSGPAGIKGAEGPQGAVGFFGLTGPVGFAGPTGIEGVAGTNGKDGTDGTNGDEANVGSPGNAGAQGPQGPQGPTGAVGPQGATGNRGSQGAIGYTGPRGPTGPQGARGPTGSKGGTGDVGKTGGQGPQGYQGVTGPRGNQGGQGPVGYTGPRGHAGSDSKRGAKGAVGDRGDRGAQGAPGDCFDRFSHAFNSGGEQTFNAEKYPGKFESVNYASQMDSSILSGGDNLDINSSVLPSFKIVSEHIGVIDPEFILSKALTVDENGYENIKIDVLGVRSKEDLMAYYDAAESGNELSLILELYSRHGFDNNYALKMLAQYEAAPENSQGVNE